MAFQAILSNAVYHRGGEFDGNIDFRVVITPKVPLKAVLDNLRIVCAGHPEPCEILGYGESDGGFDLIVYAPDFVYEDGESVRVCWAEQNLGTLELALEESEDEPPSPRNQSGCGASIVLLGAGLFGLLTKLLAG